MLYHSKIKRHLCYSMLFSDLLSLRVGEETVGINCFIQGKFG